MPETAAEMWSLIHAERARILRMLEGLENERWRAGTLCAEWSVEDVVAHLSAAANTGTVAWIRSMVGTGFNASRHNDRRLAAYRGDVPAGTLAIFRQSVTRTVAPTKDHGAWLGEVIVHGQDIARPLGITLTPDTHAVEAVARFFVAKDFAVNSRRTVTGLSLEADDAPFRGGSGPVVRGHQLDLVMAMAGRVSACDALSGDGVAVLRGRIS